MVDLFHPYPSVLHVPHWHWIMIAPVPGRQPKRTWVNKLNESYVKWSTTAEQCITKPWPPMWHSLWVILPSSYPSQVLKRPVWRNSSPSWKTKNKLNWHSQMDYSWSHGNHRGRHNRTQVCTYFFGHTFWLNWKRAPKSISNTSGNLHGIKWYDGDVYMFDIAGEITYM